MLENFANKIKSKKLNIAIIGLGYVGLPCFLSFAKMGFSMIGIDINKPLLDKLKKNINPLTSEKLKIKNNNYFFTDDYSHISKADVIIICLPTPLTKNKTPDLSFISNAISLIGNQIKKGTLICLESTSYPGTTEEYFLPFIIQNKFIPGKDIFLSYSPEREDPGNIKYNLKNTTKIVSGYSKKCLKIATLLYSEVCEHVHPVSKLKTSEFTKLLENIYRSVNIGLINELKILADKMDIDIYEAIKAATTKPFGYQPFYPGPGLGGHCIPIDPYYLTWKAKEFGFNTRFTELSAQINDNMPYYILDKVSFCLNFYSKNISNSKILLLGLAYKKNISDIRESPSLKIIELLTQNNSNLYINDPYCKLPKISKYKNIKSVNSKELKFNFFDLILIITDHDCYNYESILKDSKVIIDTRGRYIPDNKKVFRA